MARAKYDWQAIEAEYITGKLSLRALRDKHGCSLSTIAERSAKGEWDSKREQHRNTVAESTQEAKKEQKVLDRLQFDVITEKSCELFATIIMQELARVYKDRTSVDSQELKFLSDTLKRAQEIKYRALDIPPVTVVKNMPSDAPSPGAQTQAELLILLAELGPEALAQFTAALLPQAEA